MRDPRPPCPSLGTRSIPGGRETVRSTPLESVHRDGVLFANRLLLDLAEYETLEALTAAGGSPHLFRGSPSLLRSEEVNAPAALSTRHRESIAVEVRHSQTNWGGDPAGLMLVRKIPEADAGSRLREAELELRHREARIRELESILETATDGVIVIDEAGRVLSMNRSAWKRCSI